MPIVQLRHVDVFAFLDADSDEAKTFFTYAGYIRAFSDLITDTYGPTTNRYPAIVSELDRNGRLTRLRSRKYEVTIRR